MLYQVHSKPIHINRRKSVGFVPHAHHYYEMLICTQGRYSVSCNFHNEILQRGDVMMAFSNDIHSYEGNVEGEGIILIFDQGLLKPFLNEDVRFENIFCRRK